MLEAHWPYKFVGYHLVSCRKHEGVRVEMKGNSRLPTGSFLGTVATGDTCIQGAPYTFELFVLICCARQNYEYYEFSLFRLVSIAMLVPDR